MRIALHFAAAVCLAASAQAQPACGPYDQIIDEITASKYGERKVAQGETKVGAEGGTIRMEVFSAPLGKTYTILLIRPDGIACIIGAGNNLKTYPLPEPGQDI